MAANLGAKLVGPLVLNRLNKLFESPIKVIATTQDHRNAPAVTWLDVVNFVARAQPQDCILTDTLSGIKVCHFWIDQRKIEISEDDYMLVASGAPERMMPTQPHPDDEAAELGTMEILEQRLSVLIKKADAGKFLRYIAINRLSQKHSCWTCKAVKLQPQRPKGSYSVSEGRH